MTDVRAPSARPVSEMPGPPGNRLLGDVASFRHDLLGHLTRGMHRYGDMVAYNLGPAGTPLRTRIVVAYHPDQVQQVLAQTERGFTKDSIAFRNMTEMLGSGLLTSSGDEWRRQRRIVQPLFTPQRVAGYAALMADEADRVVRATPANGEVVDLHLLMLGYALRVVGRALFGGDVEDMVPVLDELVPEISALTRRRMFRPLQVPLRYRTPLNRRARELRDRQYAVIDTILARSPKPGDRGYDPGRDDLVTRLREARDDAGRPLSEAEIRDQALIFLLAGHETTAGALTFTLHLLGRFPDIQDAVADEAADVLGRGVTHVDELPLTKAVLMEGMRLYPSAHATERSTVGPTELGGYLLPHGQIVLVSSWATHRHPAFWPDAERFDPTRFIGPHDRPRYAYFPFGGGPRSCVGEHFSMLEAVVLLATVLRQRRVRSISADLPVTPNITIRPVGDVPVAFTAR